MMRSAISGASSSCAAALLLSNRRADAGRARFQLLHTVRTHMGKSDECYASVYQEEDGEGIRGVRLSRQLMQIAGELVDVLELPLEHGEHVAGADLAGRDEPGVPFERLAQTAAGALGLVASTEAGHPEAQSPHHRE